MKFYNNGHYHWINDGHQLIIDIHDWFSVKNGYSCTTDLNDSILSICPKGDTRVVITDGWIFSGKKNFQSRLEISLFHSSNHYNYIELLNYAKLYHKSRR